MIQDKRNERGGIIKSHLRSIFVACLMVVLAGFTIHGGVVNSVDAHEQVFYSAATNAPDPEPSPSPGCTMLSDDGNENCHPVDDNGGGILPGILSVLSLGLA
ncbi:MAG: hypothetical protein WCB68_14685 [Pyrinomonadaceae bacterium]